MATATRKTMVSFRASREEAAALDRAARVFQRSRSEWMRRLLLAAALEAVEIEREFEAGS